nr:MAG TPA: hypothetical protein [Caudoviricetes sp.]
MAGGQGEVPSLAASMPMETWLAALVGQLVNQPAPACHAIPTPVMTAVPSRLR